MNVIIKGDTSGVVEAIKGALQGLPQESVVLRYLLCAAGDITTSDVDLAAASGGLVVGFNLNPDENVLAHAKQLGECGAAGLPISALERFSKGRTCSNVSWNVHYCWVVMDGGGKGGHGGGLQCQPR
jgi:hypothetical protein